MKRIISITLSVLFILANFTLAFAGEYSTPTASDKPTVITWVTLVVWIISTIFVWRVYHKLFDIVYFSGKGCFMEIFWCAVGGMVIAGLIIKFAYITVPILVIIAIISARKKDS